MEPEQIELQTPQALNPGDRQTFVPDELQAARSRYCSYSNADLI